MWQSCWKQLLSYDRQGVGQPHVHRLQSPIGGSTVKKVAEFSALKLGGMAFTVSELGGIEFSNESKCLDFIPHLD